MPQGCLKFIKLMKKGQTLRPKSEPPKAYTKGWMEFYKLKFKVTPDVLIPRPETELLVDEIIKINPQTLVDIGTGSGCIAISTAVNLPNLKVLALDISEDALKVAEANAKFHKVSKKVMFLKSDLLGNLSKAPDVMVANLPYIPTRRLLYIDPMVADFEPKIALDGGYDGFFLYRKLFSQIQQKGTYPKVLIAEIDEEQAEIALQEVRRTFPKAKAKVKKDLYKADRILIIKFS